MPLASFRAELAALRPDSGPVPGADWERLVLVLVLAVPA